MSRHKKAIRQFFRTVCLTRDKHCVLCGIDGNLDVHHITNRDFFPNGGYVLENGISLCADCHWKAERGDPSAEELYVLIGSSLPKAIQADLIG